MHRTAPFHVMCTVKLIEIFLRFKRIKTGNSIQEHRSKQTTGYALSDLTVDVLITDLYKSGYQANVVVFFLFAHENVCCGSH